MHSINAKFIKLVVFADEKTCKLIFSYGEANIVQVNKRYGWKDYKFLSSTQILIRQFFLPYSSLLFFLAIILLTMNIYSVCYRIMKKNSCVSVFPQQLKKKADSLLNRALLI